MGRRPTRTEETLDRKIEAYGDDPMRRSALKRARMFKSSWIDLAQVLMRVRDEELYHQWGFDSFGQYCMKELHIRRVTADKLTASYGYLRDRASEVLDRDGINNPIPSFQSVGYLARAEEDAVAPEETLEELRREVLERNATPMALGRKFGKRIFDEPVTESDEERLLRRLSSAARRLASLLAEVGEIPSDLAADVEEQLGRLIAYAEVQSKQTPGPGAVQAARRRKPRTKKPAKKTAKKTVKKNRQKQSRKTPRKKPAKPSRSRK